MKHIVLKAFFVVLFSIGIANGMLGQLTVDTVLTPQQLVQNVLLGTGITASNITYTGSLLAKGKFSGTSSIGIPQGVILTSGRASACAGPAVNFASLDNMLPGDILLDQYDIQGAGSNDATVLEFDFVPISDSLNFRYAFGSEEYPNFAPPIGTGAYNDVFAFFISGPGIAGNQNIALIPSTSLPVSINNINPVTNPQYYIDNAASTTVAYNGISTVLTARAAVQCGQTYHIKLAIQDLFDGSYDSGVFLEAGSFSSVGNIQISPDVLSSTTNDTTLYEGCGATTVNFVRRNGNLSLPVVIDFTVTGTATNGVDFPTLPTQVTIPVNDTIASVTINPNGDGATEGIETIIITIIPVPCSGISSSTITLYLEEATPPTVSAGPDQSTACSGGGNVTLTATPANGVAPFTYSWAPTGSVTQSISVLPNTTTTYIVNVTDVCGNQASDSVVIIVEQLQPFTLTVSNDTAICQNDVATLIANYQGGNGTVTLSWSNGPTTATQLVSPSTATTYYVTATDLCNQVLTDSILVDVSANNADFEWVFVDNNTVQFTNLSVGYENLVWWDFGDQTTSSVFSPLHDYSNDGNYLVTLVIQNTIGCFDTVQYPVIVAPEFFLYVPNAFSPDEDGINDVFNAKGTGFEVYTMRVFNRWGDVVFETSNLNNGWDGRGTNGKFVMGDMYLYEITVKIKDTQEATRYHGKLLVLR